MSDVQGNDGLVVRLKSWTTYALDGISRETYGAPRGQVAVFLRLGNEPIVPSDAAELCDPEQAIREMGWQPDYQTPTPAERCPKCGARLTPAREA